MSNPRRMAGIVKAAVMVVLAGITGLSVSGQGERQWRDYAGGPDSSRFVAATGACRTARL